MNKRHPSKRGRVFVPKFHHQFIPFILIIGCFPKAVASLASHHTFTKAGRIENNKQAYMKCLFSMWAGLDLQFSTKERQMFFASTFMTIGDGNTAKFWTDRWIDGQAITEIAPAVTELVSKRTRRAVTVSQGL
jgi:hypothetical protein